MAHRIILFTIASVFFTFTYTQKCPPLFCPKCEFGHSYIKVSNGTNCLQCVCNPNPCEITHCPTGSTCQLLKEPKNGKLVQCVAKVKVGECPSFNITTNCPSKKIKNCESDDNCPATEKCCSNGCQSLCMKPCLTTKCTCLGNAKVITKMNTNGCPICSCSFETIVKRDNCELPKESGPCKASLRRYYYDTINKTCQEFIYSGCGGNENNFPMKEYCVRECQFKKIQRQNLVNTVCSLPLKVGNCRASLPRYYYDSATHTCKQFLFGGCNGNENNFDSKESCEAKCKF